MTVDKILLTPENSGSYYLPVMKKALMSLMLAVMMVNTNHAYAQSSYKLIKEGNSQYDSKKYTDAEVSYKKSLSTGKNPIEGNYNLGNAYYKEGKFEEALQQYQSTAMSKGIRKDVQAKSLHNLGNTLVKSEKFNEAVEAYKNALKLNPSDNDTRYNLAYAKAKLNQQQQQNKDQKKDQDKKDQKDQKKDQQQQQQQEQKQDQKPQEKPNQDQARKDKISKKDAEKILQALNDDEKKTNKKLTQKQPVKVSIEKEW